jgi:hypothetical protein
VAHAIDFSADDHLRASSVRAAEQLAQRQHAAELQSQYYIEQAQAAAAGPPGMPPGAQTGTTARRRRTAAAAAAANEDGGGGSSGSSGTDTALDRHNPVVHEILAMARTLGIDASTEFYLLPFAIQALAAPQEWVRVSSGNEEAKDSDSQLSGVSAGGGGTTDRYELRRADLTMFQGSVHAARLRARHTPPDNTPWIRITEGGPAPDSSEAAATANNAAAASASAIAASASPRTPLSLSGSSSTASSTLPSLLNSRGEPISHSYWYNFRTWHRSPVAPLLGGPGQRGERLHARYSPANELTVMRFTSSFSDPLTPGGARRLVRVAFHLASEEFEVALVPPVSAQCDKEQAAAQTLVYRVKNLRTKHGPASCWDLHVGAIVDLFGRPTTLTGCDAATRTWIETNARRLREVRAALASKLAKFTPSTSRGAATGGPGGAGRGGGSGMTWAAMAATDAHSAPPLVESHLRALMKDVSTLKNELAKYRPTLADKYAL